MSSTWSRRTGGRTGEPDVASYPANLISSNDNAYRRVIYQVALPITVFTAASVFETPTRAMDSRIFFRIIAQNAHCIGARREYINIAWLRPSVALIDALRDRLVNQVYRSLT